MSRYTGCPCGCMTKLPWYDDPECIAKRPHKGVVAILAELVGAADERS